MGQARELLGAEAVTAASPPRHRPSRMKLPISLLVIYAASSLCPGQAATQPNPDARLLAGTIGSFAAELFANTEPQDNLCLSPASGAMAMLMAYAGADGDTADALADIHAAAAVLDARLQRDTAGFKLSSQQSLWTQHGYSLRDSYLKVMSQSYNAAYQSLNFQQDPDTARALINREVSKQTNGLIDRLLTPEEVSQATRLILTNTLYLKAGWLHPFDPNDTYPSDFTLFSGKSKSVQTMSSEASYPARQHRGMQVVRVPYLGGDFALDLVLPANSEGLPEALTMLLTTSAGDWQQQLTEELLRLRLPRFSIQSRESLLEHLGDQAAALGPGADFSKMTSSPSGLFISQIVQATSIDVGEKGTEAAAATAVLLDESIDFGAPKPRIVHFNRPFAFALRDLRTNLVLFAGRCSEPEQDKLAQNF